MAKSQLFQLPAQWMHTRLGAFPVRRGYGDEEAMVTARTILDRGGVVGVYCEGGRTRDGRLREHAKPGIGRLALETGVDVVPIAIYGSSELRYWRQDGIPRLTVGCGEPVRWDPIANPAKETQLQVAEEILARIKRVHSDLGAAQAP